jgi:hypothetical protein
MEANCAHCGGSAHWVIKYKDAFDVAVNEAACHSCADARSSRDGFDKKSLSGVTVDF